MPTHPAPSPGRVADLCAHLASTPRERLTPSAADELLDLADSPTGAETLLRHLARSMAADTHEVDAAVERWREDPSPASAAALNAASEPPRQAVLRALTTGHDGAFRLVRLRGALLELRGEHPDLDVVDGDFLHLFRSWFTPGFLQLREVSWTSPGSVLQEIAEHESVHPVRGWTDLRSRLEPSDRTCFALVHPAMGERPLVFVEVALSDHLLSDTTFLEATPGSPTRAAASPGRPHTAATFYSINTTYAGLRGVPLGHDLLKQAVAHLRATRPGMTTFGTLSPVPGLRAWAESRAAEDESTARLLSAVDSANAAPDHPAADRPDLSELARRLERLARSYLSATSEGRPLDRVARFHLGNGASLERVLWPAGHSPHLVEQSYGLMVNYRYPTPADDDAPTDQTTAPATPDPDPQPDTTEAR